MNTSQVPVSVVVDHLAGHGLEAKAPAALEGGSVLGLKLHRDGCGGLMSELKADLNDSECSVCKTFKSQSKGGRPLNPYRIREKRENRERREGETETETV